MNRGFEYRSQVERRHQGLTVVDFLAVRYARFPREEWLRRIESGAVLIDGVRAAATAILKAGQQVNWRREPWLEPDVPTSFAVLYQSHGVLGVAKPSGLPTTPGGGLFLDNTLLSLVRLHFPDASPLHRLGRATSGIVLFATRPDVFAALSAAWQQHRVVKEYRALVSGVPRQDRWVIDVPIGPVPHAALGTVHGATSTGKPAHSEVFVLDRRDDRALVKVAIASGRPHQIRIHLAASGHPLVGDPLYDMGGMPREGSRALPGDGGYHLHAERLAFTHPVTGEWTEITCLPPAILR